MIWTLPNRQHTSLHFDNGTGGGLPAAGESGVIGVNVGATKCSLMMPLARAFQERLACSVETLALCDSWLQDINVAVCHRLRSAHVPMTENGEKHMAASEPETSPHGRSLSYYRNSGNLRQNSEPEHTTSPKLYIYDFT